MIQNKKDTHPIIIKKEDNLVGKIEKASKHFQKCFQCDNQEPIPDIKPQKLKNPFTVEEIEIGSKISEKQ